MSNVIYIPPPEIFEAAKDWIRDCYWEDLEESEVDNLTQVEIIVGVNNHYEGGWVAFLRDQEEQ